MKSLFFSFLFILSLSLVMSMPVVTESPMYHGGAYASPQIPQMAATTPYGPTPYTPVMGMQQTPGKNSGDTLFLLC